MEVHAGKFAQKMPLRGRIVPAAMQWLVALIGVFFISGVSSASPRTVRSPDARRAQFMFVIDDSKSMSMHRGVVGNDPDRLAVFAIRSIVELLNDEDQAAVVRLNARYERQRPGNAENVEPVPSFRPLGSGPDSHREGIRELLSLDPPGRIAAYAGSETPCAVAMVEMQEILNSQNRSDVEQVVFFLTDGECNGGDLDPAWLDSIDSHSEGRLSFYFLRFQGESFSPLLGDIALATGGTETEVNVADPSGIIIPFAHALSHSQGYLTQELSPSRTRINAHRGAERVRILAVAPGEAALSLEGHYIWQPSQALDSTPSSKPSITASGLLVNQPKSP